MPHDDLADYLGPDILPQIQGLLHRGHARKPPERRGEDWDFPTFEEPLEIQAAPLAALRATFIPKRPKS